MVQAFEGNYLTKFARPLSRTMKYSVPQYLRLIYVSHMVELRPCR